MATNNIERFRESIPVVQGQLGDLKEKLQEVLSVINSGKMVSDAMADSVAESLKACREKEAELRSLASELEIILEDQSFDQMTELADRVEKEMSLDGLRQVVFDYFRLTATAQDTLDALEESKKELQKVCRLIGDEFSAAFEPYSRLVAHTKSQEDLSDADYDLISDNLGKKIVRSADKRKLSIDESADISAWLDGSADLLREGKPMVETVPIRDGASPVHAEMKAKVAVEETVEAETAAVVQEHEVLESVTVPVEEPVEAVESDDEPADVEETSADVSQEDIVEENDPSLLGYVDTVHGKVAVRLIKDTPASEAHPSKFMSKAKTTLASPILSVTLPYLMTTHMVSVKQINASRTSDGKRHASDLNYLLNHGYAGILSFTVNGQEQEYYIPSSKAYATMRRESVASFIKSRVSDKTRFPEPFDLVSANEWSPLFAYRCKMIADYNGACDDDFLITHTSHMNNVDRTLKTLQKPSKNC